MLLLLFFSTSVFSQEVLGSLNVLKGKVVEYLDYRDDKINLKFTSKENAANVLAECYKFNTQLSSLVSYMKVREEYYIANDINRLLQLCNLEVTIYYREQAIKAITGKS
jgi:hypothetical protein